MEAWITCARNRKFSETLETLLLFLRMFDSVARSLKASLHQANTGKVQKASNQLSSCQLASCMFLFLSLGL